jgi:hypothetical protein
LGRFLLLPLRWTLLVVLSFACCLWVKCLAVGWCLLPPSCLSSWYLFSSVLVVVFAFFR